MDDKTKKDLRDAGTVIMIVCAVLGAGVALIPNNRVLGIIFVCALSILAILPTPFFRSAPLELRVITAFMSLLLLATVIMKCS